MSGKSTKIQRLQELKEYLKQQKFPEITILNAFCKSSDLHRNDLELNRVKRNDATPYYYT